MKNPLSDVNVNRLSDFLIKAVLENKKMSVDFLAAVGDYGLFEVVQQKIARKNPDKAELFACKIDDVWQEVVKVRHQRDTAYCQAYFRRNPNRIAIFKEREACHFLKMLSHKQSRKLSRLYLQIHRGGREH